MTSSANVDPSPAAWTAFNALPRDAPVHMLNLIRLKPLAIYPAEHPDHGKGLSGFDAYRAYGRGTAHILKRLGGRQVWAGRPQLVNIGPDDEHWDIAFIAEYPTAEAFIQMVRDPEYRELVKHRTAAVVDSRLIRMDPLSPGNGFGEVASEVPD